jgi:hypothetical protein
MINGIVVDERRHVHELDDRAQADGPRARVAANLVANEQQGRAEQLTPGLEEVRTDLVDGAEIGLYESRDRLLYALQPIGHRSTQGAE